MTIDRIAVGIDGSPASTGALRWALNLGRANGAQVRAMHAWDTSWSCIYPWSVPSVEDATRHAWSVLRRVVSEVDSYDQVETAVVRGGAGRSLIAEAQDSELVVIGCTGEELASHRSKSGEILTGSTARKVLHQAPSPVAAVPEGAVWVDRPSVVVGLDGSEASSHSLQWAAESLPPEATIHAVRAVLTPTPDGSTDFGVELLDPLVSDLHAELDSWVADSLDGSVGEPGRRHVQTHLILGDAADGLLDPGFHVDLIVVGDHGGDAGTHVLGSVSDHTLRHSQVPVVVVRATNTFAPTATADQHDLTTRSYS